jgi:hypothetical protein
VRKKDVDVHKKVLVEPEDNKLRVAEEHTNVGSAMTDRAMRDLYKCRSSTQIGV